MDAPILPQPAPSRTPVLFALALTGTCTFLNLYATQPLLPTLRNEFHASELLVSLTVSAPVMAVALAAPFVGLLADSVGRKRVIIASLLLLSLPTLLTATASGLYSLLLWRFLQGLFIPGIIAVAMAYISEESPKASTAATMAAYVAGTVVGGFLGRFTIGLCASHLSWRTGFLILGSATFLGAILTHLCLPRSTRFVRQPHPLASLYAMRSHLLNGQLLATYAVGFNVLFSLVGIFNYISFYLAAPPFLLSPAALGSIFFVYLIGAVITPFAGRWVDQVGYRHAFVFALAFSSLGILLTLIPSLPVIIAGLAFCSSGVFVCQSATSSQVGKAATHARSSAAGLYVTCYYSGGLVGSVAPGFLWSHGAWPATVALLVTVQLLTAAFAYHSWRR